MGGGTAHLELTIDLESDPISGSVSNGVQGPRRFTGWIELVTAIEAVRSSGASAHRSGETSAETLGSIPGANAGGAVVSYPSSHEADDPTSYEREIDRGPAEDTPGGADPS